MLWGMVGSCVCGARYMERLLGGCWIDVLQHKAVGIDGVMASVSWTESASLTATIRLELSCGLRQLGFTQPHRVTIRFGPAHALDGLRVRVVVNDVNDHGILTPEALHRGIQADL